MVSTLFDNGTRCHRGPNLLWTENLLWTRIVVDKSTEHRTGIAEVTGSNPVVALIFFQASSFQLLKLESIRR